MVSAKTFTAYLSFDITNHNEVLGNERELFSSPAKVTVKCVEQNLDITNLYIMNIFPQSLGTSLNRGSSVTNYSSSKMFSSLDFWIVRILAKAQKLQTPACIFLDWFSQPLNRDLDSSWKVGENHLRKPRSQSASRGSRKQLLSEALKFGEKKDRLVS